MKRIQRFVAMAFVVGALSSLAPQPASAVMCHDAIDEACAALCRVGQKLGWQCLMGQQQ